MGPHPDSWKHEAQMPEQTKMTGCAIGAGQNSISDNQATAMGIAAGYNRIDPTVKMHLERERDEAIQKAAAITRRLQSMSPHELHMGTSEYERKYSLYTPF